jgi:hypothetical protein
MMAPENPNRGALAGTLFFVLAGWAFTLLLLSGWLPPIL